MGGILIIAEHLNGAVRDITKESIGAAVSVKAALGGPVIVAVIAEQAAPLAGSVDLAGVDEIFSTWTWPPASSSTRSVKVPPMSTPMRAPRAGSSFIAAAMAAR